MSQVIAEAHFDGSRNMVAMISGVRRWIMAHPNQCESMYLLPNGHPSGRHSEVDWSNPDLDKYPNFPQVSVPRSWCRAGRSSVGCDGLLTFRSDFGLVLVLVLVLKSWGAMG